VQAGGDRSSLSSEQGPAYLADLCVPVFDVAARRHLRSAARHQLTVPRVRRSTSDTHALTTAGPTVWNSLPDYVRHPTVEKEQIWRDLKTHVFSFRASKSGVLFNVSALFK